MGKILFKQSVIQTRLRRKQQLIGATLTSNMAVKIQMRLKGGGVLVV